VLLQVFCGFGIVPLEGKTHSPEYTLLCKGREGIERRPSAAARYQHSSPEEKDYLRSMLSHGQLQGFVMPPNHLSER
jgi:hypothetical protein